MSDALLTNFPDHFRTEPLPIVTSVPNEESFIGQLFLIKRLLDLHGVSCPIEKIGWYKTDKEYTHEIPTHGVMYAIWNWSRASLSLSPKWIRSLVPNAEITKLVRLWNDPNPIIYECILADKSADFVSTNPVLLHEFFRFGHVSKIVECPAQPRQEFLNIIERWTMTMSAEQSPGDFDVMFSPEKLKLDYGATRAMFEEAKSKKIRNWDIQEALELTREWLKTPNPITQVQVKLTGPVLKLVPDIGRPFLYVFPPELLVALLDRGTLEQLACVCLRYACILQQAQQWANSNEFYKLLVHKYDASVEGFASPLNSRIILQSKTGQFCSLFPDVDAPFGSIGSFFDQDFVGKTVSVCPPYTMYVLDRILAKTQEQVAIAQQTGEPLRLVYGLPDWTDVGLIDYLELSCKYKKVVQKREYSFYDSRTGTAVPTTFANRYYILDVNMPEQDYDQDFDAYFDNNKIVTQDLIAKQRQVTNSKFLFNWRMKIGRFESRFIAASLIYWGLVNKMMEKLDPELCNWSLLFGYLMAEALLCLDKYNEKSVESFIRRELKKFL